LDTVIWLIEVFESLGSIIGQSSLQWESLFSGLFHGDNIEKPIWTLRPTLSAYAYPIRLSQSRVSERLLGARLLNSRGNNVD
jgi:hypothetical protein